MFSKIYHKLGHKENVKKCKQFEIVPCILLDHNRMKLEINGKETTKMLKLTEIEQHTFKQPKCHLKK
jgi:hypothetical protein